jgi:predicted neutral ceramidase superfamily lipid hydrolase
MNLVEQIRETTPKTRARLTGAVYLTYFLLAFSGAAFDPHGLTARSLNLTSVAIYALLMVLFYFMFKPVSRPVSLLAALIGFAGCIFSVFQTLHLSHYVVSPLIFFGIYCLLLGQLVVRSGFLPKILGVLLVLAGAGWLLFLFPFTKPINAATEVFGIVAEGAFCLWLLIAGVNPRRSRKLAKARR